MAYIDKYALLARARAEMAHYSDAEIIPGLHEVGTREWIRAMSNRSEVERILKIEFHCKPSVVVHACNEVQRERRQSSS